MSTPTSGLGVATNVVLAGTGITQQTPPAGGKRGVSQYQLSLSVSGVGHPTAALITASASDDAGSPVGGGNPSQLGVAGAYALLAAAGITNTGGTVITGGNVGSYPTATITPGGWTLVPPAVVDNADAQAAQAAALVAYNYYSALTFTSLSGSTANLSVLGNGSSASTYTAGNYSAGSSMDIPTSITLDAQGNPNAIFVFKAGSTITLESNQSVLLINGAQANNVFWIVGSSFTQIGTTGVMNGNILANTSITLDGGTLNGRALAGIVTTSGAITIAAAEAITVPASVVVAGVNAVSYNDPTAYSGSWYRPSNFSDGTVVYNPNKASVTDAGNPFTVTAVSPGQAWVEFQIPTFNNTEGFDGNIAGIVNKFPIDMITAELLVNVTV